MPFPIDQQPFIFGTVACFKRQKNIIDLFKAFRLVRQKKPNAVLEVIGDGVLRPELEAWITQNALNDAIILHGWQNNVANHMIRWHAFVLSSLWEGLPCACGQRGCLEAYVGGAAWTQRLSRETPAESLVAELAGGRERARPEHVVPAARRGDAFALAEMDRYNDYLARAITSLVYVLSPQVVILGTIPTQAGEELCFAPLRKRVVDHVWPELGRDLEIVPSALGTDLPAYAGLCAAHEGLERRPR